MATLTSNYISAHVSVDKVNRIAQVLRWTYGLLAIAAGADKFMNILTEWSKYLAPAVTDVVPLSPRMFMNIVGIIEIAAGVLVLIRPKAGSLIVGFWLLAIAINLLLTGQYFDVAVRDIVMAIGAFSLYGLVSERKMDNEIPS
jgi:uncharacterized membrane protein YphA (DoxX/SURF4 family)